MTQDNINPLSEKTVLKAHLFDVNQVDLTLKSGRKVVHHVVKRRPTVCVLPVTADNQIYLVSQYRYMLKKHTLELMAGFVDKNEEPLSSAKRELAEETGLTAKKWELLMTVDMAASVFDAVSYLYLAQELSEGIAHPEEDEDITVVKMPLEEAVEKVIAGQMNTTMSIIGILFLDKLLKEKKL